MAQKFGNSRWVEGGYLDNRTPGIVAGQITFAALGTVDICLLGNFHGDIEGRAIRFRNPKFLDDSRASESLFDFHIPQLGKVSLISFDPHPLLTPHPYFEWFSVDEQHYRIELEPGDAWIMADDELLEVSENTQRIHCELGGQLKNS